MNISSMKTVRQQRIATGKRPALNHAAIIPRMRAKVPVHGDFVLLMMAGKVITERVMYGT